MNKRRMLKWANFLDALPPGEHFNMKFYGEIRGGMRDKPVRATSACALGWATAIPEFNRAGLELLARKGSTEGHVYYMGESTENAAMMFFGISFEDAFAICLSDFDATAKQKAAQIRAIVKAA
jgi:hypothetical protein